MTVILAGCAAFLFYITEWRAWIELAAWIAAAVMALVLAESVNRVV